MQFKILNLRINFSTILRKYQKKTKWNSSYLERGKTLKKESESEVAQSCPTLCDPMDCSLPGSSVRGILQARVLEWVAVSFSRRSSQPRDRSRVSHIAAAAAKSLQSCPTLCDPIDGSPPGSPVPGILQARTLEWVAISFSNAWKWKVKVKSLSCVWLPATPWTATYQAPPSMGFSYLVAILRIT